MESNKVSQTGCLHCHDSGIRHFDCNGYGMAVIECEHCHRAEDHRIFKAISFVQIAILAVLVPLISVLILTW